MPITPKRRTLVMHSTDCLLLLPLGSTGLTYHTQAEDQHYQSSSTLRFHLYQGRLFHHGRQRYATHVQSGQQDIPSEIIYDEQIPQATTMRLKHTPMTLCCPINFTNRSCIDPLEFPCPSVLIFPKSPACRSSSAGAPWVLPEGLTKVSNQYIYLSLLHLVYNLRD